MLHISDWTKRVVAEQKILNSFYFFSQGDEHDECSLTVPNVVNLPVSYPINVTKSCRQIEESHLVEGEVPKIQNHWTHLMVAVAIASAVSEPHVKSLIGQMKGRRK